MAFAGKRVLITGGAGCLGLETAKRFDSEGATVVLLDKDESHLKEAKSHIPRAEIVVADLLKWDETREILKKIGHVDILINNAGVNLRQKFMDVTPEAIDFIFGVNFKAIVNVSQVIIEGMIASGKPGTIVNISSIATNSVLPNISMYSASKTAVNMLTRCMASELSQNQIRVNAICPHYMVTPFTQTYIQNNPEIFDKIVARTPAGRFLEPSEAVDSIIFLSSSASSMINGTTIDITGGYVAAS